MDPHSVVPPTPPPPMAEEVEAAVAPALAPEVVEAVVRLGLWGVAEAVAVVVLAAGQMPPVRVGTVARVVVVDPYMVRLAVRCMAVVVMVEGFVVNTLKR